MSLQHRAKLSNLPCWLKKIYPRCTNFLQGVSQKSQFPSLRKPNKRLKSRNLAKKLELTSLNRSLRLSPQQRNDKLRKLPRLHLSQSLLKHQRRNHSLLERHQSELKTMRLKLLVTRKALDKHSAKTLRRTAFQTCSMSELMQAEMT